MLNIWALAISLILLPIVAAQKVPSCSFPGVTCRTCLGRYESGTRYSSSLTQCGWCGSRSANTSDPDAAKGYCIAKNDRLRMCLGETIVFSSNPSACDFVLSPGAIAAIVIGALAGSSALLCYSQSRKLGASSRDQAKWLLLGLVLPVVSVVVLIVLARRGHFTKVHVTSPVQSPPAYEQYSDAATASETPHAQDYGGGSSVPSAPAEYNTQQYVSPAPYNTYDPPQPYSATSADYNSSSAPYGQQQQGYGYPPQSYSSAPPPYNNISGV
jgi:hypothetical protein